MGTTRRMKRRRRMKKRRTEVQFRFMSLFTSFLWIQCFGLFGRYFGFWFLLLFPLPMGWRVFFSEWVGIVFFLATRIE